MLHIIGTIIIGFVAGVLKKSVTPGDNEPQGFILTTVLGIVGAFVATYLGQAVGWVGARSKCRSLSVLIRGRGDHIVSLGGYSIRLRGNEVVIGRSRKAEAARFAVAPFAMATSYSLRPHYTKSIAGCGL